MNASELHTLSARSLAERVRDGGLTAAAAAQYFIERVGQLNPALNAIIQFDPARVLAEAAGVDVRLACGEDLPMAGVLVTVKDNIWVAGYPMRQGSKLYDGFIAPQDAWAVARLRARGAVVLGITNCSEFACKAVTTNPLYGTTRHPLDPRLTPGGSSGGAVAALACGLGSLALGTDAGGSTRRPAAHCGLVGLKPSLGIVPHPVGFAEPNFGNSVVGLLARDVADCAWLFDQLCAYDAADPVAPPLAAALQAGIAGVNGTAAEPGHLLPRSLRIGWSPQLGCEFAVDDDVMAALQSRIDQLRAAGWNIADTDPQWPACTGIYPLIKLQLAGLYALYGQRMAGERNLIDPDLAAQIDAGGTCTPQEIADAIRLRERIIHALACYFDGYDLLLCPTAPVTAWPIELTAPPVIGGQPAGPREHAAFTPLFNYCGVPAISVPAGLVRNLPVGLQIVAPKFEDARVLRFAAVVEASVRRNADSAG